MKPTSLLKRAWLPAALVGTLSAAPVTLDPPKEESRNHFGANFRLGFNATVDFKNIGAFGSPAGARRTPDGAPFNYDDGYVLTDSSGNLLGFTRYWGYDNASQIPGNGTVVMHTTSSTGASASAPTDDPNLGFELTYQRELGRNQNLRWGLESAFNYLNASAHDSRALSLGASRVSTPYQLPTLPGGGFVSPPPAPYYHGADLSTNGNPVLFATPLASSTANTFATMTGTRDFEADVFGFRLGPYLELPLGQKWRLTFSGGLALAFVNSDFRFTESVALPNVPTVSGSGSHNDVLIGGYVSGGVSYKLNPAWDVSCGVQFQKVGNYSHTINGRTATLNLDQAIFVVIGASYSF